LSDYLHDLGICLHFQNDPALKNTVILKPQWGTDAVYRVLDDEGVIRNFGRFTRADLAKIWREEKYAAKQDELLRLMINFQLCYEIPNSRGAYIAPQLLTKIQPAYGWGERDNIILRYTYEFMPKGILTLFIVVMHSLIADQAYVWRSGVILAKDETWAEVIEDYGKREIRIRVVGKHKRDLLTIITYRLEEIHDSFNHLKFKKLIPCNCSECKGSQTPHFYDYESLRTRLANKRYDVECDKSYQRAQVLRLIDDIGTREALTVRYPEKELDLNPKRMESLQTQLRQYRRILNKLEEQAASYGAIAAPTHLLIEIEDEKKLVDQLEAELGELQGRG
jgi:internalin A